MSQELDNTISISSKTETLEEISSSAVEDEELEEAFLDVDLLLNHGVSADDVTLLRNCGINTIKGIEMCTRRTLLKLKGFNADKVNKIKDISSKLNDINSTNGFLTALEVSANQRKQIFRITTGSSNLDKLLGGGIESMSITEAFGESKSGKTQLSHTLCVTAQLSSGNRYGGGKVIYIDTEHTFRPDRIKPISERFDLDHDGVLQNILNARPFNSEKQYELLTEVCKKFHEEPGMFKLLIIDSIMALFRVDFASNEMIERQHKIGLMLSKLQKISEEYNVAVFITNQISQSNAGINNVLLTDDLELLGVKPVGGNVLAHSLTTRIALKKGKGNARIVKLYDSPDLEETEAEFVISKGGIGDPKIAE